VIDLQPLTIGFEYALESGKDLVEYLLLIIAVH
jgi:hypothetical protein